MTTTKQLNLFPEDADTEDKFLAWKVTRGGACFSEHQEEGSVGLGSELPNMARECLRWRHGTEIRLHAGVGFAEDKHNKTGE